MLLYDAKIFIFESDAQSGGSNNTAIIVAESLKQAQWQLAIYLDPDINPKFISWEESKKTWEYIEKLLEHWTAKELSGFQDDQILGFFAHDLVRPDILPQMKEYRKDVMEKSYRSCSNCDRWEVCENRRQIHNMQPCSVNGLHLTDTPSIYQGVTHYAFDITGPRCYEWVDRKERRFMDHSAKPLIGPPVAVMVKRSSLKHPWVFDDTPEGEKDIQDWRESTEDGIEPWRRGCEDE